MFVKICGTTNLQDAETSLRLGADALGLIFAPSRRQVSVAQAAAISQALPPGVMLVGVFTEPTLDQIEHAVREVGLAAVQMHWPYAMDVVAALRARLGDAVQLWQVVGFEVHPIDEERALGAFARILRAAAGDPELDVILLDAVRDGASGGLGQSFSWRDAASAVHTARIAVADQCAQPFARPFRLAVAGGLRVENVEEAIAALRPWGVDVVSGVEAEVGKKDSILLARFVHAAREAEIEYPCLKENSR